MKEQLKILIALLALCLFTAIVGRAQSPGSTVKPVPPATAAAPQLKDAELLKIRNIQLNQAARTIRMQQLQAEFKDLAAANAVDGRAIDDVITTAAKASNIDLTKWIFDAEKLAFVERPKEVKESAKKE